MQAPNSTPRFSSGVSGHPSASLPRRLPTTNRTDPQLTTDHSPRQFPARTWFYRTRALPAPQAGAVRMRSPSPIPCHFRPVPVSSGLRRVPAPRGNFSLQRRREGRGEHATPPLLPSRPPGRAPWPGPAGWAAAATTTTTTAAALSQAPGGDGRAGAEERAGMASPPDGEQRALRERVAALEADLGACRRQLERAQRRLRRNERLYREAREGSEALRRQVGPRLGNPLPDPLSRPRSCRASPLPSPTSSPHPTPAGTPRPSPQREPLLDRKVGFAVGRKNYI